VEIDAGERVAKATRQRASVLAHIYCVLSRRLGADEAADLLREAIRAHGVEKAKREYSVAALTGDLLQAAREFAAPDPVKQHQFGTRLNAYNGEEAEIAMARCPLVDQWREMGLPPEEVSLLCGIARSVDFGTWEGAMGFHLRFEGTRGEGKPECILRVRKSPWPEGA
jgi:hypothetical protein